MAYDLSWIFDSFGSLHKRTSFSSTGFPYDMCCFSVHDFDSLILGIAAKVSVSYEDSCKLTWTLCLY